MDDSIKPPSNPTPNNQINPDVVPSATPPVSSTPTTTPTPPVVPEPPKPTAAPASPASAPASTQPHKPKAFLFWTLIIVIVLALIIGLSVYFLGKKNNTTTTNSSTVKKDIPLINYAFFNNPLNAFYPSADQDNGPQSMNEQIFEGLVSFTNGIQVAPNLAASWTNPNDTTWIFTLKPNIYYHDGDTVTAQDVVYSWQQLNAQNQQIASYITPTIKNVVALNNLSVEITTTQPDAILLNRLASLWIIDSKAPKGTQPWELGTGPYTVKSGTTPTANNIDLVAFNKWHGGHIYTKAVNFIFYPDQDKAAADLIAGKVTLADGMDATNAATIAKSSNKNIHTFNASSINVDFLGFNTKNPSYPTANPNIREAIALTLDPQTILNAYGINGTVTNQIIPPQIPGFIPSYTRPAMNLTEAKQLVSAAYPNGVTINLGIGEPALAVGQEMAKELKPIGITLNLDEATSEGTYFGDINNGTYQAFYEEDGSAIADASDVLSSTFQDTGYYSNAAFDSELTTAEDNFNPTQRLQQLEQADQTLLNNNIYIPLYINDNSFGSVKGIVYPLNTYDEDLGTFFANVYQD